MLRNLTRDPRPDRPSRRAVPARWSVLARELGRAVSWHRRWFAAALVGVAVLAVLQVLRPTPAVGVPTVAAALDLPAGAVLDAADLHVVLLPAGSRPAGAARSVAALLGARLASPVRSGEAVTDVRLVGPAVLAAYGSRVGPDVGELLLPVADAATASLVRPGDSLDVLAAPTAGPGAGGPAVMVARGVPVLAVPASPDGSTGGPFASAGSSSTAADSGSAAVLVAVTPTTAGLLAAAAVSSRISILVHPG